MKMQKVWVPLAGVAAMLCLGVWTGTALAAPLSKPCETNGPMGVTTPDSYTYVQDADGGTSRSFTVSSPTGTKPNDCKIKLG